MPFLVLVALAVAAGLLAASLARLFRRRSSAAAVVDVAREAGEDAGGATARGVLRAARGHPDRTTELGLTVAAAAVLLGGLVLAVLAVIVRSTDVLAGIDTSAAEWGNENATAWTHDAITLVTRFGEMWTVLPVAVAVAVVEIVRTRNGWVAPFLVAAIGGATLLTEAIKAVVDRARPEIEAVAATLGPSFPSGHTCTAAASWAAIALVVGRWWGPRSWPALAGCAVGIAVAVAASRVLLDVHWLTDVVAGLALGWAWFAACAVAFGGHALRFGAAARAAGAGAVEAAPDGPA